MCARFMREGNGYFGKKKNVGMLLFRHDIWNHARNCAYQPRATTFNNAQNSKCFRVVPLLLS